MGRRRQGIYEAGVGVRRKGTTGAHHKAPCPASDGRLPSYLGGHFLHCAVQAEADGVDIPQDRRPAGHPLDHLLQFDAERLLALLHGDGIHLQFGDALQSRDNVAADIVDREQPQGAQVVEVGPVIGPDELVVTARRDRVRPGKDLLHIDPVDAHLRPGGHHLLGLPEFALQEVMEQPGAIVLDEHQSLETQQVIGIGKGGIQHGGEKVAVAIVGHHPTRQVKVAPGQQFLTTQDRETGVHVLRMTERLRGVPQVAQGGAGRGQHGIATGDRDLVHRDLFSGPAVPVAERPVLAADDFGALGPGAGGPPVHFHPVRPHLEDAVGLVERLGPKAGVLLMVDRVDRASAHPTAVEFDVVGAFKVGQEKAQVGRRGGEHVHLFAPERPAHPFDGEEGIGLHLLNLGSGPPRCVPGPSPDPLSSPPAGGRSG